MNSTKKNTIEMVTIAGVELALWVVKAPKGFDWMGSEDYDTVISQEGIDGVIIQLPEGYSTEKTENIKFCKTLRADLAQAKLSVKRGHFFHYEKNQHIVLCGNALASNQPDLENKPLEGAEQWLIKEGVAVFDKDNELVGAYDFRMYTTGVVTFQWFSGS